MGIVDWILDKLGLIRKSKVSISVLEQVDTTQTNPSKFKPDASQEIALKAILGRWDTEVILVHGAAGTGKSKLIELIVAACPGRTIVVATSGMAAANVGGITVHSQFLFPPTVLRFCDPQVVYPLGEDDRRTFELAEFIVIDEVSMLRADVLDAIDWRLRNTLGYRDRPFAGKRVVLVGDLLQLDPVVSQADREFLAQDWPKGHFFFHANVWQTARLHAYELSVEHRHSHDQEFIACLRRLRNGESGVVLHDLNDLVSVTPEPRDRPILVTTNRRADSINKQRLDSSAGRTQRYEGVVDGDFPKSERKSPDHLILKTGAKVMVTTNSQGPPYAYVNGTIGEVVDLGFDTVAVRKAGGGVICLARHRWQRKRYVIDPESDSLKLMTVGTFEQIPLKLAWAFTVHKSQGLSFESIYVDTNEPFFASGHAYVALTRCRSTTGTSVSRPIRPGMLRWDQRLRVFLEAILADPIWPKQ